MDARQQEIDKLRAEISEDEAKLAANSPSLTREEEIAKLRAEIAEDEAKLRGDAPISMTETVKKPFGEGITQRDVGRFIRGVSTGIASMKDTPNYIALGLHKMGLKENPQFYDSYATEEKNKIDRWTKNELKPQTTGEEYFDSGVEALAPLALAPFTGGASLTGMAAKNIGAIATSPITRKIAEKVAKWGSNPYAITKSNIAGTIGSSAAVKTYIDNAENPGLLGSLAAGFAGGSGARAALSPRKALAPAVGAITRFDPAKYDESVKLGIPVSLANTAKGKIPAKIEGFVAHTPGHQAHFDNLYKNQEAAIAGNLGVSTPHDLHGAVMQPALHLAKEGADGYKKRVSNHYGNRKSKYESREQQAVQNKEMVDVSDIIGDLESKRELSLTPEAKARFDKTGDGVLLRELKESVPQPTIDPIYLAQRDAMKKLNFPDDLIDKHLGKPPVNNTNKEVGYHDLSDLRKKAQTEAIRLKGNKGESTLESIEANERKTLLADKENKHIQETGTKNQAHNAKEAKIFWAQYKDKQKGTSEYVRHLTKAKDAADAFKKLSTHGHYLNVVRQGLPKSERQKLAETFMTQLGDKNGKFDVNKAATGFTKLKDTVKKEYNKLLPNKEARDNFQGTLEFIKQNKKMLENISDINKTGELGEIKKLVKTSGKYALHAGAGTFTGFIPYAAINLAVKGGSKLWTDPKFLNHINNVRSGKESGATRKALDQLAKTVNQLARSIK